MKKVNWPKITLTSFEKVWLKKVYEKIKSNQRPEYKILRIELLNEWPQNFDPASISRKVARNNGLEITLLGIYLIEPKSDLIKKINLLIGKIKADLIANPAKKDFNIDSYAEKIGLSQSETSLAFTLITQFGKFWNAGSYGDSYGFKNFSINDEEVYFNQYITFTCAEDLINRYYKEESERENLTKNIINKKSNANEILSSETKKIAFNPIFHSRTWHFDPTLCFVLMPFTEEWSKRVYENYIRKNVEEMGLQCLRADDLTGKIIIEDIWVKINQAAFIIADVTGKNPNVMYELGIVHSIGKPAILITQDVKGIPFDFSHLRHYGYKDDVEGAKEFSSELKRIIPKIYDESYPDSKFRFWKSQK